MGRIAAGDLDQRVTLLTSGPAGSDGRGGNLPSAQPDQQEEIWAKVRPLSGREVLNLGQTNNPAAYEITIRKRKGVAAPQRVKWLSDTYNVQRVVNDTRNEYHLLTCFNSGK